jgi:uncharacterized protein YbaP (TraB family)
VEGNSAKKELPSSLAMKPFLLISFLLFSANLHSQYQRLLWKISGNGLKKESFLFGTMHVADERVIEKARQIAPFIGRCDAFAMEILFDENQFDLSLLSHLLMKDGTTLSQLFTKQEYWLIDSLFEATTGFSLLMFDQFQPIVVSLLLDQPVTDHKSTEPLDMYLMRVADSLNKPLIGIETLQEQLRALQTLNYQEQADMLREELKKKSNNAFFDRVLQEYLEENVDSLMGLYQQNPMPEKLEKAVITNRNQRMTQRIAWMIQQQSVFCAVGALHLPGKNGIVEGLRKRGFLVEPVK